MLRDIVVFEWRYHTRQAAFFAACALFLVMGFALGALGFGSDNVPINSSFLITESLGFLSLFALFAAAIFAANAVLRDDDSRMRDIVDSTPAPRIAFIAGRFFGALLATLSASVFAVAGQIAATLSPWADPARIAPFDLRPFLSAFAMMMVPNVLFTVALIFAVAMLSRNSIATYAASVVTYLLYFVISALSNSPMMAQSKAGGGGGPLFALLDPFGLAPFFDITRYWTGAVKSTRFVPLEGTLLANRLILIAASLALWTVAWKSRRVPKAKAPAPTSLKQGRGVRTANHPLLARIAMELRTFFTRPVLLLYVLWIGLVAMELQSDVLDGEYASTLYPATGLITAALQQPLWIVGALLIVYYGSEMFWRERRVRMDSILDSTPVSGTKMIVAKLAALAFLISTLIVCGIGIGLVIQVTRGYTDAHMLLYLSLFYIVGLPLVLYAAASLLIHSLSPNKYAGMVFVLAFIVFTRRAELFGLEHPLWRFADGPSLQWSDLIGFGNALPRFHKFMLHWSALAILAVACAAPMWRRIGSPLRERVARPHWIAAACGLIALGTGTWIFATTERGDTNEWRAGYEKKYKSIASLQQPVVRGVDANVDFGGGVRIAARYALANESPRPIQSVFVNVRRDVQLHSLAMTGARPGVSDSRFGVYRFDLDRPLAPGAHAELRFELTSDTDDDSLLLNFRSFPSIGYHRSYELRDPRERSRQGLPAAAFKEGGDFDAEELSDAIDFRATLSAPRDRIAVTSGALERTWLEGDRRYFRYRADAPIRNRFGFACAHYEVARRQHGAIAIELYHDASHGMNVQHMLDTAETALDVMQESVGPYLHHQLRIIEVTSNAPFGGYALPGTILLREDRAFLTDARDPRRFDLIARRVAHEVAHQWFGYRIAAGDAPGGLVITESLAKYGELLVLEKLRGREQVQQLLSMELESYLSGRARDTSAEVPLNRVEQQPYLYYSKGAIVLWAARDLLGPDAMARAIHAVSSETSPTGSNLTLHLSNPLIDEWMNDITHYDFRVDDARATRRADGRWDVALRVHASKTREEKTALPLREPIEIAIDEHVERRDLHDGMNELTFIVPQQPELATVDPWITRIDRNPANNSSAIDRN